MKKGRELISLPVIDTTSGQNVGEIKDIIYEPVEKKIMGFIIEEAGWLREAKLLPFYNIREITEEAIYINTIKDILDGGDDNEFCLAYKDRKDIRGSLLVDEHGVEMGIIGDLLVNTAEGKICGYELSDGVIHDLLVGRKSLFISGPIKIKEGLVQVWEVD